MSDRYFVESPITTDQVLLAGPEAHHLIHVMRAKAGSHVTLFDGSGCQFDACVQRIGRTEVALAILSCDRIDRELPIDLTLGVALPKGDRQKWLVEKAVELGVGRLVPLETARGVAQGVEKALDRLRRTVVEASKQCGRNRLLEIAEPRPWAAFVADTCEMPRRLLAHPTDAATGEEGKRGQSPFAGTARRVLGINGDGPLLSGNVALAIGPEGGFTEEEVSLAVGAGWQRIDLGPRILRVETAAVLLSAMIAVSLQADS